MPVFQYVIWGFCEDFPGLFHAFQTPKGEDGTMGLRGRWRPGCEFLSEIAVL